MDLKIVFTGTPGAGKTTAIAALSDIAPIVTDVANSDPGLAKAVTTVGLDYGHVDLGEGVRVRLFGTPGQQRFDFMWRILVEQALGLVILIDNSRPDPRADLRVYLDHFADLLPQMNCAIGVGRTLECPLPTLDDFTDLVAERGLAIPTLAVDVRERHDVLRLIDAILAQAEAAALTDNRPAMNLRDHPYSAPGARAAQDLLDGIDGARTVLVATIDGFSLAVAQRHPLDADRLAALISSIGALGAAASRETGIGTPRCLVVESTQGRLVVRCVKAGMHELVVGVLTDTQALLGMVWAALAQCEKALLRA